MVFRIGFGVLHCIVFSILLVVIQDPHHISASVFLSKVSSLTSVFLIARVSEPIRMTGRINVVYVFIFRFSKIVLDFQT